MGIKERFKEFIAYKRLTQRRFQASICVSSAYINSITDGIGADVLRRVSTAYPELNTDWLLTGEGEMLNPSVVQNNKNGDNINGHSVTVNKTESEILTIIKTQAEQISIMQKQISKSQDQIDRLLALLENKK